jgi:hypothetical protein
LFRSSEQMTMKIRIIDEEARRMFPELARDFPLQFHSHSYFHSPL